MCDQCSRHRAWNSLGRFLKRGEKGILILAPMVGKSLKKNQEAEQSKDAKQPESKGHPGAPFYA